MTWAARILPLLFAGVFLFAAMRRVKVYDSFAAGASEALPLLRSLFPYVAAVLVLAELFEASGLSARLQEALAPAFSMLGIPREVAPLILIKPFSGSGSMALLSDLYAAYGPDSYIARCASVIYASGETIFYISAIYFAGVKMRRPALPVAIALISNLAAFAVGCLLCRVL